MTTVADALTSVTEAQRVTPPTPATGSTVPVIGDCGCPGAVHFDTCAHRVDVRLGQGGERPCVEVDWDEANTVYICGCGKFSSPDIVDIEWHQRGRM